MFYLRYLSRVPRSFVCFFFERNLACFISALLSPLSIPPCELMLGPTILEIFFIFLGLKPRRNRSVRARLNSRGVIRFGLFVLNNPIIVFFYNLELTTISLSILVYQRNTFNSYSYPHSSTTEEMYGLIYFAVWIYTLGLEYSLARLRFL